MIVNSFKSPMIVVNKLFQPMITDIFRRYFVGIGIIIKCHCKVPQNGLKNENSLVSRGFIHDKLNCNGLLTVTEVRIRIY